MLTSKIAIGCDHAGFALKQFLIGVIQEQPLEILDFGAFNEESVDYPDFSNAVTSALIKSQVKWGILICGTGLGMSISANRFPEIRAALCFSEDMAKFARLHNDANIIVFGSRITEKETAKNCLNTFLNTEFEGGRHQRRIAKFAKKII